MRRPPDPLLCCAGGVSVQMDLEQEIESLKGSFQARLEVVRLEAANHVEDADKVR